MANPEHLKIVKAWKETKDKWQLEHCADPFDLSSADLSGADLRGIFLQRVSLINANLEGTNFEGANLLGSDFSGASLENANLKKAILVKAIFDNAYMPKASLESARCREALFRHTNMMFASLKNADLSYANFDDTDLRGADLTDADVSLALFLGAGLINAKISGIKFSTIITEGWVIEGVICTHFFVRDNDPDTHLLVWKRIPEVGNFEPGEFEKQFESRQTIESVFERDMLLPAMPSEGDCWITITEAADLLAANRGVISRWASKGKIKDNGKKKRERRVLKSSVLLMKDKIESEDRLRDSAEILRDMANEIPDEH